jgi:hypothetical protein
MSIGSRFTNGRNDYNGSVARRLATNVLSRICGLVTGQRITDATSGFRAYSRRALEYLADYYPPDYPEPESIEFLAERAAHPRDTGGDAGATGRRVVDRRCGRCRT